MNLLYATTATLFLVIRAITRKSLTPAGILAAVLTAGIHALHPWNLPFTLLITFYFLATAATKVKEDIKATLTISSSGTPGGEGPRNHVQVLANSIAASLLVLLHSHQLGVFKPRSHPHPRCFANQNDDLLVVGVVANYAAVLADTLSSELGILARSPPRLITSWAVTPKGTNGGVTLAGLGAGAAGAAVVGVVAAVMLPGCEGAAWGVSERVWFVVFTTVIGTAGSLLDSLIGAVFQQSVVDVKSRKIVEAPNGKKVLVEPSGVYISMVEKVRSKIGQAPQEAVEVVPEHVGTVRHRRNSSVDSVSSVGSAGSVAEEVKRRPNSRMVITAEKYGVLNNNQVNLVMSVLMSVIAMVMWGGLGKVGVVVGEQVMSAGKAVVKQEIIGAVVGWILAPILG